MNAATEINNKIKSFEGLTALVIGDVMTDAYVFGKVDRISPEAPVPVVHISHRENRPGGAANVALNLKSLGAIPILCSVTGDDEAGQQFIGLLENEKVATAGILKMAGRKTTVKTRVIGNNHQLIRVDDETIADLAGDDARKFIRHCIVQMQQTKPAVIIFEDYDKGVLTAETIAAVTAEAGNMGIPIAVDPKKRNFSSYNFATLFKPNLHELVSGLNIQIDKSNPGGIVKAVRPFMAEKNIRMVMVTLSEAGVLITDGTSYHHIPAHVRNISDVSGAGDTVISVAALCMAIGLPMQLIAGLSNLAGGLVCEEVGVVPINRDRLMDEITRNPLVPDAINS